MKHIKCLSDVFGSSPTAKEESKILKNSDNVGAGGGGGQGLGEGFCKVPSRRRGVFNIQHLGHLG